MRWNIAAPVTLYLVYRSYSHGSLTPLGIVAAAVTATLHALHPSPLPFTLLVTFFMLGTTATKIKAEVKATLTMSSTGSHGRAPHASAIGFVFSGGWNKTKEYHEQKQRAAGKPGSARVGPAGGQEPRSAVQVLANSACVSLLCLLHVYLYGTGYSKGQDISFCPTSNRMKDLILLGIIANYAAVTADTLSSELGILSQSKPRFILQPWTTVPPGTNGGVTFTGILAGGAGATVIGTVSALLLPAPGSGTLKDYLGLVLLTGGWGTLGSALDSILGALLQASVIDRRSGKVVEAPNGGRVLVLAKETSIQQAKDKGNPSRAIGSGRDILDNNQVNFVMAATMTLGAIGLASVLQS